MGKMIDEDLIKDFKSKIKDYDKDYAFSQEEVLNILERYEIKYAKSTIEAIPKDQYEQRLKADLVAALANIKLELEEHSVKWYVGRVDGKSDDVVLIEDVEDIFKKYMEEATNEMP